MKVQIITISYFDVNQKNGGAIFAKNLHLYINNSSFFESKVFCPIRGVRAYNEKELYKDNLVFHFFYKLIVTFKNRLVGSKFIELVIHFLRNDLNAFILVLKLYLKVSFNKNSIFLFHDHLTLFYFSLLFPIRKFNVVMVMHNDGSPAEMVSSGIKSNFKSRILNLLTNCQIKSVIFNINKIIFLCDSARNKFIELYNINAENTAIIPNGIKSIGNFTKTESSKIRFITVCTMNERKGIDTFIKCLPCINEKYESKIEFTLIGQGPLLEELKHLQSIYNNINVVGESSTVSEYLHNSDVFFLLSKNEGQPLSILEALRASLFILATNVGCNASMVNENNGFLVDPNPTSIIDAFFNIIDKWDILKSKGQNSVHIYENSFTEDKMYKSYLHLFKNII